MTRLQVDTDLPAGNAIIDSVSDDTIRFRPDCRDTLSEPWFYWALRVRGCAGRRLNFQLTVPHSLTTRGAAVSADGGWDWEWTPDYDPSQWAFSHDCGPADDLQFSLAMPYTRRKLDRWLQPYDGRAELAVRQLCRTRQGRSSPHLVVGRQDGGEAHHVLITARHHSCEMMANYVLEGLLDGVLARDPLGARLAQACCFHVVPMVDLDGVEAGDQGKCRHPHDHNRDYIDQPIYPETVAIRQIAQQCDDRLRLCLDLHGPWVRGEHNEHIYIVGSDDPANAQRQLRFAGMIQASRRGPLPYRAAGTLPHGQAWNVRQPGKPPWTFGQWMTAHAPGQPTVASLEVPYAVADGVTVTQPRAKAFGRDLATAIAALCGVGTTSCATP